LFFAFSASCSASSRLRVSYAALFFIVRSSSTSYTLETMLRNLPMAGVFALASIALAQGPPASLTLTLDDALQRARPNSQQLLSADITARIAHEDRVQAKAALLPTLNWFNGFIYTQPNGTDTGIFVGNNGTHEYSNQAIVHADYSPGKRAEYQMTIAAEAIA